MYALAKRWISASTAIAAGVLGVTGCSDAEGNRSAAPPTAAAPSRTFSPPLTAAQLKALALKGSEVPQAYDAAVQDPEPESEQRSFPPASVASCQRALDVLGAETGSAAVTQIFNWKDNVMPGGSTLASYEGAKAQEAFRRLQDSLRTCKSFIGTGWVGKYSAKVRVEKAPDVGDEALSLHVVTPAVIPGRHALHDEHFVFVRVGNITVSFNDSAVGQKAEFPRDLIEKQVDRLSDAQRSH